MKKQVYLSVIIPSFNEEENIQRGALSSIFEYLRQQTFSWELVFSDDGSTDNTVPLLKEFAKKDDRIRVIENVHRGKGPTVGQGMLAAQGSWRLFADFDQATPICEVEKLLQYTKDFSVIIGSREVAGAKREKEPFHRHVMGKVFNLIVQVLALHGIHDSQCGFKLFSAQATEVLFPKLQIYNIHQKVRADAFTGAFDVELLYLARKMGFPTTEVAISWSHIRTNRVNPIKDSWRMFVDVMRIRLASVQGLYR